MQIKEYVKPELLVVAIVLYFIGLWIKQSETIKDKFIPLINGALGILFVQYMLRQPAAAVQDRR